MTTGKRGSLLTTDKVRTGGGGSVIEKSEFARISSNSACGRYAPAP